MTIKSAFQSLVRFFQGGRLRTARRDRRGVSFRARLFVEVLENRELLSASPPTILAVSPLDGQHLTTGTPNIAITYSEPMLGDNSLGTGVSNPNNYVLLDSAGTPISIQQATLDSTNTIVTLSYNNGQPLPIDTYTLFVRGDRVFDVDDDLPLARSNQLIVANGGASNIAVVTVNGDGTLGSLGDYALPQVGTTDPNPVAVGFGDFNNDGNPDLAVVNAGTNTVSIFLGRTSAEGFGFSQSADLTLQLTAGTANLLKDIVVADFNKDGLPDIAVVSQNTNEVILFKNTSSGPGDLSFDGGTSFGGLTSPVAMAAGDFDGDGFPDLVVANSGLSGSNYTVSFFHNNQAGGFDPAVSVTVGNNTPSNVTSPNGLAIGDFTGDTKLDVAVSGTSGIGLLTNTSTGVGNISFTLGSSLIYTSTTVVTLASGKIDAGNTIDLVAGTSDNHIVTLLNDGSGNFTASTPLSVPDGTQGQIVVADLNNDGQNEVLVSSGLTTGKVSVLDATTDPANPLALDTNSPYAVDGTPMGMAVFDTNADGKVDLVTANRTGNTFSLLLGNGDRTFQQSTNTALTPTPTGAIAYGDVNGDGIPDIVVANNTSSGAASDVSILLGKSDGTYAAPVDFPVAPSGSSLHDITSIALGDINGDGKLDIAMAGSGSSGGLSFDGVGFLINNIANPTDPLTSSSFTAQPLIRTGNRPTQVVLADFNNDGILDLAVAHNGSGGSATSTRRGVTILLGNGSGGKGDGTFGAPREIPATQGVAASGLVALDFNKDGNMDLAVTQDAAPGNVYVLQGDGSGNFSSIGKFDAGLANPGAIAVGDFNNDGFPDIVVASKSTGLTSGGVSVLLNQLGGGFGPPQHTDVLPGTGLQSLVVSDVNEDGIPDVVVGALPGTGGSTTDNVFVLTGRNDGTFNDAVPYLAGGVGTPTLPPSFLAIGQAPLTRVTTFTAGGNIVQSNLVANGGFETADLSGEKGNLTAWNTYRLPDVPGGSVGQWDPQKGTTSPLSGTSVPLPDGTYQAMLDEANLQPYQTTNPNPDSSYAGSHALYQDITIPANATKADFSMRLYLNSASAWTDTTVTPILDYRTAADDQQVRVDIIDPTAGILTVDTGVLQNLFVTDPTMAQVRTLVVTADLLAFAGQTIRLRIATTNNRGKLIVGVDDVKITTRFADSTPPTLTGLGLRNPGFLNGGVQTTTDDTLVGTVGDDGSINNVSFIEFDPNNDGFGGADDIKTTTWDATGNFSFTFPELSRGLHTIGIRVVDKAGNATVKFITFNYQDASPLQWQAFGPSALTISDPNLNFTSISGRITAIVTDPSDPLGNTYYIGSANGGVWKTTDGGTSWAPLTDHVTDASGNPVFVAVGGMAISPLNPKVLYVGTGVADGGLDSRPGSGILKSINGGRTWTVAGNSATVLAGARISKMIVDNNNPDIAYAAVASGGSSGPGVYQTTDGGLTWTNVMVPTAMVDSNGNTLAAGAALASVTDLVIDPFNSNRLLAGLGNVGLVSSSAISGVWLSTNKGNSWAQVSGGDGNVPNSTIPTSGVNEVQTITINATGGTFTITFNGATTGSLNFNASAGTVQTALQGLSTIGTGNATVSLVGSVYTVTFVGSLASTNVNQMTTDASKLTGGAKTATVATIVDGQAGGTTTGVVKIAMGNGRIGDERFVYVFMGTPPGNNTAPNYDQGGFLGLYKSSNNLLDFTKISLRQDTVSGPTHNFQDISFGKETAYASALVVDPNNPNVLYLGASRRFDESDNLTHAFIRIDTGNMQDANSTSNNGDDASKAAKAASQGGFYDLLKTDPYTGEGVYWYDIEEKASNKRGNFRLLPDAIHALTFDSQGRLLIGTEGGIWRGIAYGFGYDFTSGGQGIIRGKSPPIPGMTLTAINSNLQIADVTSVAIDPVAIDRYYVTMFGAGGAGSSGLLNWASQDLTGPTDSSTTPPTNLGIPNAGLVRAASAIPGAPADTPTTLFRLWQYLNSGALRPETSGSNGDAGSWGTLNDPGINVTGQNAGNFPALAVNPNKIFLPSQNIFADEMLFGTNAIYLTQTSGNAWDRISPQPLSSKGGLITAVGIAPSGNGVYYAGTNLGEVFVSTDGGGLNASDWPERDTGLPALPVTSFAIDPNDDNTAYVTFGGTSTTDSRIWKTTDAGVTWTDISGSLPKVAAYSVVVDRRPALGAPNGKIYLGTDLGVYATVDEGKTWVKVGAASMPNAPVVDLQLYPGANEVQTITIDATGGTFKISFHGQTTAALNYNASADTVQTALEGLSTIGNGNVSVALAGGGSVYYITFKDALGGQNVDPLTTDASGLTGGGQTATVATLADGTSKDLLAAAVQGRGVFVVSTAPFSPIEDQVIDEHHTMGPVTFLINNVGVTNLNVTLTGSSDNKALIPDQNITFGGSGGTRTITIVPADNYPNDHGTATITVTVSDGTTTLKRSFLLTVNFVNEAPTVTPPANQIVNQNTVLGPLPFTVGDEETAAGSLTVTASADNKTLFPDANISVLGSSATRTLTLTPATDQFGTARITISVQDSDGGTTTGTFDVLVPGNAVFPFTDNFDRPDNTFLGGVWNVQLGNIQIQSDLARNFSAFSIATLRGISQSNVFVQSDVQVVSSGQFACLTARQTGTGNNNMYVAGIRDVKGVFSAVLGKIVNGTLTVLKSTIISTGTATLRFEVVGTSLKLFLNDQLTLWTNDSTFTGAGTVGLWTKGAGTTYDNFSADTVPLTPDPLPFSDNFDTATRQQLSASWVAQRGNFNVSGGVATNNDTVSVATLYGVSQTDVFAQADIQFSNPGQYAALVARYSSNSNMYRAGIVNNAPGVFTALIQKVVAGIATTLKSATIPSASIPGGTGTIRFEVVGSSLKLFLNDQLVAWANDRSITGAGPVSTVGLWARGTGVSYDNFSADEITVTNVSLKFSDDFTTATTPPQQLSSSWATQAGNFKVDTTLAQATNNDVKSLATLNSVSEGDVFVQADVAITAPGPVQSAGLVARYGGVGDTNMYVGRISNAGGVLTAAILRNVGGTWTTLTSKSISDGTGTLRFEVVGTSLKLFLDLDLIAWANDSALTSGSVGMRATGIGTSYENFSADKITVTNPTLPFSDDFSAADPATHQQLIDSWATRAGNFKVDGGVAQNNDTRSLAVLNGPVLNGVPQADVSVQADIALAAGQSVGLVARYSSSGDMYLGVIQDVGGVFTAIIYRFVGGVATKLKSATFSGGSGTLLFEVTGSSLTLTLGSDTLSATDTVITAAGSVGMRATGLGTTLDNFSADIL